MLVNPHPVRLETRSSDSEDWRGVLGFEDATGAQKAFTAAARWIDDSCFLRLVVNGQVKATRDAQVFDGRGIA
jgi:hypothetical protein